MLSTEDGLLQAMRDFIRTKRLIQSDENVIAKTIAVLAALQQLQKRQLGQAGYLVGGRAFTPGQKAPFRPVDLLTDLVEDEAWAETFARIKADDQQMARIARAAKVGYFLKSFRLSSIKRDQRGQNYGLEGQFRYSKITFQWSKNHDVSTVVIVLHRRQERTKPHDR